jgi:hypothetical protein
VTLSDFETPLLISEFGKEVSNAFGILELRNDALRRRVDALKVKDLTLI